MPWFKRFFNSKKSEHHAERNPLPDGIYCNAVAIPLGVESDEYIRIVPLGDFPYHHVFGHKLTAEHLSEMVANFNRYSTDVFIDYDHESVFWGSTRAAGWITELELREDGLYCKYPEFTPAAREAIANREFRYFSPVYFLETNGKDGERHGARLDSVALTNRPYFDEGEIDPVGNASSVAKPSPDSPDSLSSPSSDSSSEMERKRLLALLGLADDADDAAINSAYVAWEAAQAADDDPADPPEKPATNAAGTPAPDGTPGPLTLEQIGEKVLSIEATLSNRDSADQEAQVEALVNQAITDRKILPREKPVYVNAARHDFKGTKASLDGIAVNTVKPTRVETPESPAKRPAVNSMTSKVSKGAMDYVKQQLEG